MNITLPDQPTVSKATPKNKGGRPPQGRTEKVSFYCTPEERLILDLLKQQEDGGTLTSVLRQAMVTIARERGLLPAEVDPARMEQHQVVELEKERVEQRQTVPLPDNLAELVEGAEQEQSVPLAASVAEPERQARQRQSVKPAPTLPRSIWEQLLLSEISPLLLKLLMQRRSADVNKALASCGDGFGVQHKAISWWERVHMIEDVALLKKQAAVDPQNGELLWFGEGNKPPS